MSIETVITGSAAMNKLRGALLGERVAGVYQELTGGRIGEARESGGNVFFYGRLQVPAFTDKKLVTAATIAGRHASLAVLEMGQSRDFDLSKGLLNHPRTLAGVETGYFDLEGQPLDIVLVERGDLELAKKLAVMRKYIGTTGGNWKFDLHSHVSTRILSALTREINLDWISS